MEDRFDLIFDLRAFEALDEFALLAHQSYNLENQGDWFGCFRGGLYGMYARLHGVREHYRAVHSWLPRPKLSGAELDYQLASIMFNMDSAIECFVYALNGLGNAVAPQDFLDVTDSNKLKRVAPWNIAGDRLRSPLGGYPRWFPSLAAYWPTKQSLLERIVEQHDVSKHRTTIFTGGMARQDPPAGFYEKLGIPDDPVVRAPYWPMKEIALRPDPKSPLAGRTPSAPEGGGLLEDLADEFRDFIATIGQKVIEDATEQIQLPEPNFRK